MKSGYDQFFKKARENAGQSERPGVASKTRFDIKNQRPPSGSGTSTNQEMANELRGRMQARKLQQQKRRRR